VNTLHRVSRAETLEDEECAGRHRDSVFVGRVTFVESSGDVAAMDGDALGDDTDDGDDGDDDDVHDDDSDLEHLLSVRGGLAQRCRYLLTLAAPQLATAEPF